MKHSRLGLVLAATMMASGSHLFDEALSTIPDKEPEPSKEELTRRAEKSARALAKAQEKRERKAAKRIGGYK